MDLIPGLNAADFRIESLSGGLTNRVYKLSNAADTYVLRLNARHTAGLGLDRATENRVLQIAHTRGLAPEVMFADEEGGILLLRYVDGRVWTTADLVDDDKLEALAKLLRGVHALPLCGKQFDASIMMDTYIGNFGEEEHFVSLGLQCKAVIDNIDSAEGYRCCHNDVVAENLISSDRLMLLDWEYSCDNEPFFDLASLIAYHELDDVHSMKLLSAYAGGVTSELRERLADQVRLYNALYCLWLATRQILNPNAVQARKLEELRLKMA
jgi:thiamine kinase